MNRALWTIGPLAPSNVHDLILDRSFPLARSEIRFEKDRRIRIRRRTCSLDAEYVLDTVGISQERMSLRKGRSSCLVKHFLYEGKRNVMDSRNGTRTEWIVKIQRPFDFCLLPDALGELDYHRAREIDFAKKLCSFVYVCACKSNICVFLQMITR